MSFKLGARQRTVAGRLFVDHNADSLRTTLLDPPMEMVESWVSADVRPGRCGEHWLNAVFIKHYRSYG